MVLVGEGGDELFGGYPTYLGSRLAGRYARWPAPLRRLIAAAVRGLPPSDRKVTLGFLLKRFVDGAALAPGERHLLWTSNLPPALLADLGAGGAAAARAGRGSPRSRRGAAPRSRDHARRGPAHQGRSREHELRPRAARAVPRSRRDGARRRARPEDRIAGFTTKAFLKRYAERYLPRSIVYRRKRGLSVPLARWLRGPLREWARGRLDSPRLADVGIARAPPRRSSTTTSSRGRDHARALWTLMVLAEWLDSAAGVRAAGLGAAGMGEPGLGDAGLERRDELGALGLRRPRSAAPVAAARLAETAGTNR